MILGILMAACGKPPCESGTQQIGDRCVYTAEATPLCDGGLCANATRPHPLSCERHQYRKSASEACSALSFQWAKTLGPVVWHDVWWSVKVEYDLAVDDDGNILALGMFNGASTRPDFLHKYNASGELQYRIPVPAFDEKAVSQYEFSISHGSFDTRDYTIAGSYSCKTTFGKLPPLSDSVCDTATVNPSGYIVRIDSADGTYKSALSLKYAQIKAMRASLESGILIYGLVGPQFSLAGLPLHESNGYGERYMARLASDGATGLWQRFIPNPRDIDVAVFTQWAFVGNKIAFVYNGRTNLAFPDRPEELPEEAEAKPYTRFYGVDPATGAIGWTQKLVSRYREATSYATAVSDSDFVAVGNVDGDGSVVRVDASNGEIKWRMRYSSSAFIQPAHAAVDPSGTLYVVGSFLGALDFGQGIVLDSPYDADVFVAAISLEDGRVERAVNLGSSGYDFGYKIAADANGLTLLMTTAAPSSFGDEALKEGVQLIRVNL